MTRASVNEPRVVLGIVEAGASLHTPSEIAAALQVPTHQVAEVLTGNGFPDEGKMTWARDLLRRRARSAEREYADAFLAKLEGGSAGEPAPVAVAAPRPLPEGDASTPAAPRLESSASQVAFRDVPLLLQPIIAREEGDTLVVVAGHRRLAALVSMGWSTAPTVVRGAMRTDDVIAAMLIENSHRQDLDPIDEARGLAHLRGQMGGAGVTQAMLAKRVGRNQTWVAARMSLLALTPTEQDQVRAGELRLSDAVRSGRQAAGTARREGYTGYPHLGIQHPLQPAAQARCKRLNHKPHGRMGVSGSNACGECWESVIRANERQLLHEHSGKKGACALCNTPITTTGEGKTA